MMGPCAGERLELADPFGTTPRWSENRIWSAGHDGRDNGGHEEKDFVLRLP